MHLRMSEEIKNRDLQDFQMVMIGKLEAILRQRMIDSGLDFRHFKIGGHERGVYERFFRVEPAATMSKPQFVTALLRCFGEELKKNEAALSKMFDSFDLRRRDEMDWRAFLYLLTLTMQPDLPCFDQLRFALSLSFITFRCYV